MKYILLLLFLVGCSERITLTNRMSQKKCSTIEEKRELASFIIKCSEAANPKSDEEGEDLVIQCERTGINTLCSEKEVCQTVRRGGFFESPDYGSWENCK